MLLQLIHPLHNRVGGSKGVSASLQEDADVRGRIPVLLRLEFIIPAAHFDPGYITQMDGAKRRVAPQHDVSELLRIHELVAAGYRVEELLVLGGRRCAGSADTILLVLGRDRFFNIGRRDAQLRHPERIHPDTHGGFHVAVDHDVTDIGNALQFVNDIDVRIVRHGERRHALIGRRENDAKEVIGTALSYRDTDVTHSLRQFSLSRTDAVIDFENGVIRICADLERAVDTDFTA